MKKVIKLILVLLWMFLIFSFSAQNSSESGNMSSGFIVKTAQLFVADDLSIARQQMLISEYSFILRKTAHFSVYFILGILVLSFLREYRLKHILIIALVICCIYSISDEFHQTFVPGRSGEVRDVCIDTSGALLGIMTSKSIEKLIKKRQ